MVRIIIILFSISSVIHAQEWKDINLISYSGTNFFATSWLSHEEDDGLYFDHSVPRYGPANLFDGNIATAWIPEAENSGIGESVYLELRQNESTINIYNGYGKNQSLFEYNNRVKKIKLSYYTGIHPSGGFATEIASLYKSKKFPQDFYIQLEDSPELQTYALPLDNDRLSEFKHEVIAAFYDDYEFDLLDTCIIIKLKIVDVYKGTHWDETCISEIFFSNTFVTDKRLFIHNKVENIYVDIYRPGRIMIDLPGAEAKAIIDDETSVFQIIETSPDSQWATVIRMPANVGHGRAETQWLIINTFLGKIMNNDIEKTSGVDLLGPFYLAMHDEKIKLEHAEGKIELK